MRHKASFGIPLLTSGIGALFSAWHLFSSDATLCLTAGCTLQHNVTIGGVSLWWPGTVLFAVLFLCAAFRKPLIGAWLCAAALIADLALLVLMLLTAPCFSCLLIAFLMALCFSSFLRALQTPWKTSTPIAASCLLAVWGLFFVINAGLTLRESIRPWAISSPVAEAPRANVYFSTSCSACRRLVLGISPREAAKLAWYPIAEKDDDIYAVNAILQEMRQGLPLDIAFRKATDAPHAYALSLKDSLLLKVKLWINHSHVLLSGHDTLPFIEFFGVPDALLRKPSVPAPAPVSTVTPARKAIQEKEADLPFINLEESGFCTGSQKQADCH